MTNFELAMVQASTMSFQTHTIVAVTIISCKLFGEGYAIEYNVANHLQTVIANLANPYAVCDIIAGPSSGVSH